MVAGRPTDFAWPVLDERSAATLCFTTGTTGDPKGVAYSHRSIWLHALSLCTANAVGVSSRDCGYVIVPMFEGDSAPNWSAYRIRQIDNRSVLVDRDGTAASFEHLVLQIDYARES